MIIVQNPLITYRDWIIESDLDWADTIASNFFETFKTIDETKKLMDVPKEVYDAKLDALHDYFLSESPEEDGLTMPELEWKENMDDYDSEKEFIPGESLKKLVNYINKFIELDDSSYCAKIAELLFQNTDYRLSNDTTPMVCLDDFYRNKQIKSLLEGDIEAAKDAENEMDLEAASAAALLATKKSWSKLIIEDFNRQVIYNFETRRLFGDRFDI